jgi:anaerobic magnesium-protoporphyrin IX monomethyl ester cyclase
MKKILLMRVNSSIESAPAPLGLLYIASYLRNRRHNLDIKIVDARCNNFSRAALKEIILEYQPDLLGLTSMHDEMEEVHKIAKLARELISGIRIVIGGPYATADYYRILKDDNIDFAVVGEGEEAMDELILSCSNGCEDLHKIKGLAYKEGGNIKFNGHRDFIHNLDTLPFPAWDLIDLNNYFYGKKRALENPLQIYKRALPLLSSRGCPYQCIYCHNIFGKRFRARSPENIVKEIELLHNSYKIREIEFIDDSFNIDTRRAREIFSLIIRNKLNIKICFSNGIRIDKVDDELLNLMKQAGVYRINYGIESGSKRIQTIIKKNLNIDIIRGLINKTIKKGMLCGAFFMIGFPTETEEEMLQTLKLAFSSKLHTAVFAIVQPFPSTEIYDQAILQNSIPAEVNFSNVHRVSLNLSRVADNRLQRLRIYAYRRFYFDPIRALRILCRAPAKIPVFKNFIEVIKVAFFKKVLYSNVTLND